MIENSLFQEDSNSHTQDVSSIHLEEIELCDECGYSTLKRNKLLDPKSLFIPYYKTIMEKILKTIN